MTPGLLVYCVAVLTGTLCSQTKRGAPINRFFKQTVCVVMRKTYVLLHAAGFSPLTTEDTVSAQFLSVRWILEH